MVLKIVERKKTPTVLTKTNLTSLIEGDFHTGSRYGLVPDNAITKEGVKVTLSDSQKSMWEQYGQIIDDLKPIDVLILMGDICEGVQYRSGGVGLITADTDDPVRWATNIIDESCKKLKPEAIIAVRGTEYHTTRNIGGDLDYQVAEKLSDRGYNVYFGIDMNCKIGDMIWNIKHSFPRATVSRLSPLEKMFAMKARDFAANRVKVMPDVFLRGHLHVAIGPVRVEQRTYGVVSPCLKELDPYLQSKDYTWEPDLGVLLVRQTGKYLDGELKRIV